MGLKIHFSQIVLPLSIFDQGKAKPCSRHTHKRGNSSGGLCHHLLDVAGNVSPIIMFVQHKHETVNPVVFAYSGKQGFISKHC